MFNRTWYRHTAYVLHPVEPRFPKTALPFVCCVHNDTVTDAGTLFQTNWQSVTPPGIKIISSELVYKKAPYHYTSDTVREPLGDVEDAKAAGQELSLHDAVIKRVADTQPPQNNDTQSEEWWDLYKVELESLWPESLYDPDSDPGMKCVIM